MTIIILHVRPPPRNTGSPPSLTSRRNVREVAPTVPTRPEKNQMEMLNPHCGLDRDARGVVRLTICNAGSLNILSSAVTNGVREGFEKLAGDKDIRAVILAGQSEKSMIGGADIKEMAKLEPKSAEAFITRLRDLCGALCNFTET